MRLALHRRLLRLAMEQHLAHVVTAASTVIEPSVTTGKERPKDRGDVFLRLFFSRSGKERQLAGIAR
jgi:hypothetical protein